MKDITNEIPSFSSWKRSKYGFNLMRHQHLEALGRYMKEYDIDRIVFDKK